MTRAVVYTHPPVPVMQMDSGETQQYAARARGGSVGRDGVFLPPYTIARRGKMKIVIHVYTYIWICEPTVISHFLS